MRKPEFKARFSTFDTLKVAPWQLQKREKYSFYHCSQQQQQQEEEEQRVGQFFFLGGER